MSETTDRLALPLPGFWIFRSSPQTRSASVLPLLPGEGARELSPDCAPVLESTVLESTVSSSCPGKQRGTPGCGLAEKIQHVRRLASAGWKGEAHPWPPGIDSEKVPECPGGDCPEQFHRDHSDHPGLRPGEGKGCPGFYFLAFCCLRSLTTLSHAGR